ncbi:phosphatase PAP2 family protein [Deinococcus yavapaiensis]|uniref:PAP2 superfamily protein n=1 Tax=Deinococcus yavapaiensis KR-236 TaxID=694435 RepID=A0A318SDK6_9DEIO|nr:phosphatase PAP2 family protein [Deinococcus yavapaiensis]PYE54971.1 PAP2 superfamily protein [Deinococcus yavapaiensis KR-236]
MDIVRALHDALGGPESFWLALTQFGSDYAFIVLMGVYIFFVNPRGARDFGVWFSLSLFTNGLLKTVLDEPRPFQVDASIASDAAKDTAGGPGFPSGHAQISATIWGSMALAARNRVFWGVAAVLVLLIALSRVVLGVHFLSDIVGGVLIGAIFVALLARVGVPKAEGAWRFVVPIVALVAATVFSSVAYMSMSMGLLSGFWLTRSTFEGHRNLGMRLVGTIVGIALVFAVYFAFRVIPESIRHLGLVEAVRYMALVLIATEGVPRLLRLKRAEPRAVLN